MERRALNKKIIQKQQAQATLAQETAKLREAQQLVDDTQEAQKVLQELAKTVQQRAHTQIARVVTRCLKAVFQEDIEMAIIFEPARGRTQARLVYFKDGNEIEPSTTSGGVLDVASLALRLIVLVLSLPATDKVLVLDEPFKMVDANNSPRVAALIETLAQEMGVQFVLITHNQNLQIGKVIRL